MSHWAYIKAVIDINIDNMHIEADNAGQIAKAETKLALLFENKIRGTEGSANVFCNFDGSTTTGFSFDEKGESVATDYLSRCSITISGSLRDRTSTEVMDDLKKILQVINADEDVYVESWNSIGSVWETGDEDEPRIDLYPLLEEMCSQD